MRIVFWVLANLALLLAVMHLLSALRVRRAYQPLDSVAPVDRRPMSLIAAVGGDRAALDEELERLLAATRRGDQLVLVSDGQEGADPGLAGGRQYARPTHDVVLVTTAPATDARRPHPFAAALPHLDHALVACLDDGVEIAATNLDEAARLVAPTTIGVSGTGAVFAFCHHVGPVPLGGALLAAFTNGTLIPQLASLALRGTPRFLPGGVCVTTRAALETALARSSQASNERPTVLLGQALRRTRQRLRPLRRPVPLRPQRLGVAEGIGHVLDELNRLRAQGVGLYLGLAVGWNPLGVALLAALLGLAAATVPAAVAASLLGLTALARALTLLVLNRGYYRLAPASRFLATTLLFETLLAPWLFLIALFRGSEPRR